MVKTTIMLDDQIYKQLIDESVRRFGSTKRLSYLINQKLRGRAERKARATKRLTVRLGRKISEKELEEAIEKGWDKAVKWSV
jgi:hypothetical protein